MLLEEKAKELVKRAIIKALNEGFDFNQAQLEEEDDVLGGYLGILSIDLHNVINITKNLLLDKFNDFGDNKFTISSIMKDDNKKEVSAEIITENTIVEKQNLIIKANKETLYLIADTDDGLSIGSVVDVADVLSKQIHNKKFSLIKNIVIDYKINDYFDGYYTIDPIKSSNPRLQSNLSEYLYKHTTFNYNLCTLDYDYLFEFQFFDPITPIEKQVKVLKWYLYKVLTDYSTFEEYVSGYSFLLYKDRKLEAEELFHFLNSYS